MSDAQFLQGLAALAPNDRLEVIEDALYDLLKLRAEVMRGMPYADYLLTEHWHERRAHALARAAGRCQVCNVDGDDLQVHHRTYENLGNEQPEDLTVLCDACHGRFHETARLAA